MRGRRLRGRERGPHQPQHSARHAAPTLLLRAALHAGTLRGKLRTVMHRCSAQPLVAVSELTPAPISPPTLMLPPAPMVGVAIGEALEGLVPRLRAAASAGGEGLGVA